MTHRKSGVRALPRFIGSARAVSDRLVPKQQSAGEAISDGVITAKVRAALLVDPITAAYEIHVETLASVVELTGFVETATIRAGALRLALNVTGVRQVNDSLDIRRAD